MGSEYRILYVEDDNYLREVITELLRGEGLECTSAADGIEAIRCLETQKFDLLITDIRMPRMDGTQLLIWCRKNCFHFPVIFITANDELLPIDHVALKDCCASLLKKPVGLDVLLRAIEAAKAREHNFHCLGKTYNPDSYQTKKDFPGQHYKEQEKTSQRN